QPILQASTTMHRTGLAQWWSEIVATFGLLYVLTGVVRLYTEFYEPVEMRRGDSAYYDATMGHNVVSVSPEDATILWVTSLT
ncbi:MAG: cupin domain-containing protein, partial [Pseudomonadota bacterium]